MLPILAVSPQFPFVVQQVDPTPKVKKYKGKLLQKGYKIYHNI